MVLLDYGLGMENLETALPFIVFDVERALTRVEQIPLLLQNSSRLLQLCEARLGKSSGNYVAV